jgi:preprotein translocase subunit YajC
MNNIWILAQAEGQEPATITSEPLGQENEAVTTVPGDPNLPGGSRGRPQGFGNFQYILIAVMIFFVFMMFRGPRKKQQAHKKMVQSLQKNDRVRTIGGIYGTVVEVRDDEIVLKVDESNNTKIKISPSAIGTSLSEKDSP